MAKLGEEREHNLSELNQKRVQHVTTLQQMGKHFIFHFDFYEMNWKVLRMNITYYSLFHCYIDIDFPN